MSEPLDTGAVDTAAATSADTGAADKAASAVSGTLVTSGDTADKAAAPVADKPAVSWRDKIAGEDKTFLKSLSKYSDEAALGKAHQALLQKMSSGEYKQVIPYPDKGTPEQQAAWRKEQGVPEKPEEYIAKITLPNGIVPGDADKPALERLAKFAHGKNWTPDQHNAVLEAYYAEVDAVTKTRGEQDGGFKRESEDTLRTDWGNDYRPNLNAVKNLVSQAPKDVQERLFGGRTADGKLIGDDPSTLKWLAQLSREINPAASLLPPGSQNMKGVSTELDTIRDFRRKDPDGYERDQKMQARELELLDADLRMKKRA